MVTTTTHPEQQRKGASCMSCETLHKCTLRYIILSPYITCCDYAKEGCTRYQGQAETICINPKKVISEQLIHGRMISVQQVSREYNLDRQIFYNCIHRLKSKGMPIVSREIGGGIIN